VNPSGPVTKTVAASVARQQWSELINSVARDRTRVVIEKSGVPVGAIVSTEDLERLNRMDADRARRFELFDRMREAFSDVSEEQLEQDIAEVIDRVRQRGRDDRS
jgi:prevent-host-death family protein